MYPATATTAARVPEPHAALFTVTVMPGLVAIVPPTSVATLWSV